MPSFALLKKMKFKETKDHKKMIMRGGFGFIYTDHNQFTNPAHFARGDGFVFGMNYITSDPSNPQSWMPSMVLSNGDIGIAGYISRTGSDILSNDTTRDMVGGALAMGFLNGRLFFGGSYERSIDYNQTSDGAFSIAVNLTPRKHTGLACGLGFTSTVNQAGGDQRSAVLGLGYSFKHNRSLEFLFKVNDLNDFSYYESGLNLNMEVGPVFTNAAYDYLNERALHRISLRIGARIRTRFELSISAKHVLGNRDHTQYGTLIRVLI